MPLDEPPRSADARSDDGARESARDASAEPHEALPPLPPFHAPSPAERPLPRGCHPLVFGVVLATLQFAATCYFMPSCFHPQG